MANQIGPDDFLIGSESSKLYMTLALFSLTQATAHRWLSWLSIRLPLGGRKFDSGWTLQLGFLNNWGKSATFLIVPAWG